MTAPFLMDPFRLPAEIDAAIARLGDLGDQLVPTGAIHKVDAWLGRPTWLLEGVDLGVGVGDLPALLTLRDDLRITGNLLVNLGFNGLVTLFTRTLQWPTGRLIGLLTGFAPNVGAGVDAILELTHLGSPHVRISSRVDGEFRRLHLELEPDLGPAGVVVALTFALQMHAFLESRPAPSWGQVEFGFAWEGPGPADPSPSVIGAVFRFGQPVNSVTYPVVWDGLRNPMHDPMLWGMAQVQGEALREATVVSQVRRLVTETIEADQRPPTLRSVASALGKSVRSLERNLTQTGITFRMIVEEERKRLAAAMLSDHGRTIQEISDLLGFSDRTSFTRSFRAWFNVPPAAFRLQLQVAGR